MNRSPNAECRMPIVRTTMCLCASVALCLSLTGCASPGGLTIGPVSYYMTSRNEVAMSQRAIAAAPEIKPEQKRQLLKAVNLGIRPGEFAFAVGVDLLAIPETTMTWSEILKNFVGVVADSVIYAGVGYGVSSLSSSGSDSQPSYNFTFQGSVNNSSVQAGSAGATQSHSQDNSAGKRSGK